jgi:hypothetical protein
MPNVGVATDEAEKSSVPYVAWTVIAGTNASAMIQALVVIAQHSESRFLPSLTSVFSLAVVIVVFGSIGMTVQALQVCGCFKAKEEKGTGNFCCCKDCDKTVLSDTHYHVVLGICVSMIQLLSIVMNTVANSDGVSRQTTAAPFMVPIPPTSIPASPIPPTPSP